MGVLFVCEKGQREEMRNRIKANIWWLMLCSAALLAGCTTYLETRPPAERKAQFAAATQDLIGEYDIIDSRKAGGWEFTHASVTALPAYGVIKVTLSSPAEAYLLRSQNCKGWHVSAKGDGSRHYAAVMCDDVGGDNVRGDVSFFNVDYESDGTSVTDHGAVLPFKPMIVPPDSYELEVTLHSGRTIHYVMKRK